MNGGHNTGGDGLVAAAFDRWIIRLDARSTLTADDHAAIRALPNKTLRVDTNRDFLRLGECADHACLIGEGLAARFGQTGDGLRIISAIHLPGDMADLHSVVAPLASSALTALAPTTIVQVPHEALKALADERPRIARAFWRDCVADAMVLAETVLNIGRRSAMARLAHLLCELAIRTVAIGVANGRRFPLSATQTHLGDATGLTAVHVNRMVRELRELGLVIIADRQAEVRDWRGLKDLADFRPDYLHLPRALVTEVEQQLTAVD